MAWRGNKKETGELFEAFPSQSSRGMFYFIFRFSLFIVVTNVQESTIFSI